jgi:hypothetical protein
MSITSIVLSMFMPGVHDRKRVYVHVWCSRPYPTFHVHARCQSHVRVYVLAYVGDQPISVPKPLSMFMSMCAHVQFSFHAHVQYGTYLKLPQVNRSPFSNLRTVKKINQKYS